MSDESNKPVIKRSQLRAITERLAKPLIFQGLATKFRATGEALPSKSTWLAIQIEEDEGPLQREVAIASRRLPAPSPRRCLTVGPLYSTGMSVSMSSSPAAMRYSPRASTKPYLEGCRMHKQAAVGNGDGKGVASYQRDRRNLFHEGALVVVRASRKDVLFRLTTATAGLTGDAVAIDAKAATSSTELR